MPEDVQMSKLKTFTVYVEILLNGEIEDVGAEQAMTGFSRALLVHEDTT